LNFPRFVIFEDLTTMEKYVLFTFVVLFVQGMLFWFLSDMYIYRCDYESEKTGVVGKHMDWLSGVTRNANETKTLRASCESIHYADRILLFSIFISLILKNLWFLSRVKQNSTSNIAKQFHFIDLGALAEFSLPEPLSWISPTNNKNFKKHTIGAQNKLHTLANFHNHEEVTSSKKYVSTTEQKTSSVSLDIKE
jgi:hypothetical protein